MYGSTFLPWELKRLKEISDAKKVKRPNVSGCVKVLSRRRFALLPTPITPQDYLNCICTEGLECPPDNAYVNITGRTEWRIESARSYSTMPKGFKETVVDDWVYDKPDLTSVKPDIGFKDFKTEIFERFPNVEPLVENIISFQIISSPRFANLVGGLNVSLYDSTKEKLTLKLIRDLM